MSFKFKALAACLVLCGLSSNALAVVCTSTTSWGSLGPPGSRDYSNSFGSAGTYTDCYTFSLSGAANSFGGLIEIDPWLNRLDIDVSSVSLFNGGVSGGNTTGSIFGLDINPVDFTFAGLSIGTYSLVVVSNVTRDFGYFSERVGYRGSFTTARASTVPVSEPGAVAILGLGLAFLGIVFRRRAVRAHRS
jgi:hypothetical protein